MTSVFNNNILQPLEDIILRSLGIDLDKIDTAGHRPQMIAGVDYFGFSAAAAVIAVIQAMIPFIVPRQEKIAAAVIIGYSRLKRDDIDSTVQGQVLAKQPEIILIRLVGDNNTAILDEGGCQYRIITDIGADIQKDITGLKPADQQRRLIRFPDIVFPDLS